MSQPGLLKVHPVGQPTSVGVDVGEGATVSLGGDLGNGVVGVAVEVVDSGTPLVIDELDTVLVGYGVFVG